MNTMQIIDRLFQIAFFAIPLSFLMITEGHPADLELQTYTGKKIPEANSTILLTESKALLIDAQFLASDARTLTEQIKSTNRDLTAILVTHTHPDHVWGAVEVLKAFPNAKVYARKHVRDEIILEFRARLLRWTEHYDPELPTSLFDIDELTGDVFLFDNHEIEIIDLKPAETIHATAFYVPELKAYIAGDQVFHKHHPYVAGGLNAPEVWIDSLNEIKNNYDIDMIVPGHGSVGDADILDDLIKYLNDYAAVSRPLVKQAVIANHMLKLYPGYGLKEVLFMTTGPAVTSPELLKQLGGSMGFATDH